MTTASAPTAPDKINQWFTIEYNWLKVGRMRFNLDAVDYYSSSNDLISDEITLSIGALTRSIYAPSNMEPNVTHANLFAALDEYFSWKGATHKRI